MLGDKVPGVIDRTTSAQLDHHPGRLSCRKSCDRCSGPVHDLLPRLFDTDGDITIGPIPAGVPVNLLANLQPLAETGRSDGARRTRGAPRAGC